MLIYKSHGLFLGEFSFLFLVYQGNKLLEVLFQLLLIRKKDFLLRTVQRNIGNI